MVKYYIHDGEKQSGALDKEELKSLNITKDTPIWFEPLKDWTTAGEVEDLKNIFENLPPAFNLPKKNDEEEMIGFSFSSIFGKKLLFVLSAMVVVAIVLFIYGSSGILSENESINDTNNTVNRETIEDNAPVDSKIEDDSIKRKPYRKSATELKNELLINEQRNPLSYLSISASEKQNKIQTRNGTLFRSSKYKIDGYLIDGYISNSATFAVLKDVVCKVSYESQTGSIISTENFTIYDYIYPSDSIKFKQKVYPPSETFSFSYEIVKSSYVN